MSQSPFLLFVTENLDWWRRGGGDPVLSQNPLPRGEWAGGGNRSHFPGCLRIRTRFSERAKEFWGRRRCKWTGEGLHLALIYKGMLSKPEILVWAFHGGLWGLGLHGTCWGLELWVTDAGLEKQLPGSWGLSPARTWQSWEDSKHLPVLRDWREIRMLCGSPAGVEGRTCCSLSPYQLDKTKVSRKRHQQRKKEVVLSRGHI